jgi:hypothetical protein
MMRLNNFFQNAYVTRNLEHAMAAATERHGVKDYVCFEPHMEVYTAEGGYGPAHVKVALAWVDQLQLEFIEPVSGNIQHYLDRLPTDRADNSLRFHHICMRVMDWDKAREEITRQKWPVSHEGGVEGVKFIYLDARDTFGHYIEYMWMSDEMWQYTGPK